MGILYMSGEYTVINTGTIILWAISLHEILMKCYHYTCFKDDRHCTMDPSFVLGLFCPFTKCPDSHDQLCMHLQRELHVEKCMGSVHLHYHGTDVL